MASSLFADNDAAIASGKFDDTAGSVETPAPQKPAPKKQAKKPASSKKPATKEAAKKAHKPSTKTIKTPTKSVIDPVKLKKAEEEQKKVDELLGGIFTEDQEETTRQSTAVEYMQQQVEQSPIVGEVVKELVAEKQLSINVSTWQEAVEFVDYPVYIRPLFFILENDSVNRPAVGITNTGRDTEFFGVVVDRNKTGHLSTIATVTGVYGTILPVVLYREFEKEMIENGLPDGISIQPKRVYVAGNGGMQQLTLGVEGIDSFDDISMEIKLISSLDGTKKHHMRLSVYDNSKDCEVLGIDSQEFELSARHTKSIGDRHFAYQLTLLKLIEEWNKSIMPYLRMFYDTLFERDVAVTLLKDIVTASNIPERHAMRIIHNYESDDGKHSPYSVLVGISSYLETNLKERPERLESFKKAINKKSAKIIEKTLASLA